MWQEGWKLVGVLIGGLLVAAPVSVGADAPVGHYGTEADPELVDPGDDVEYAETYTGPPHDYLDVLALWLEYNDTTDKVVVTLKTAETESLESPPAGFTISCGWALWVTMDDEENGYFSFGWRVSGLDGEETSSLRYLEPQADGTTLSEAAVPIAHEYGQEAGAPGYHRTSIEREALLPYADAVNNVYAVCEEYREPISGIGFENQDDGSTQASFDLVDLEPRPVNETDDEFLTPRSSEAATTASGEASALAAAIGLVAVLVATLRKRHG